MVNKYSNDILIRDKLYAVHEPWIMGIINLSPESFYSNESKLTKKNLFKKIESLIASGVDIIDIGAVSTKPNSEKIDFKEEHQRIIPLFKEIRKEFSSTLFSIDSTNNDILSKAVDEGVDLINDVSGAKISKDVLTKIGQSKIPYILTYNIQPNGNEIITEPISNIVSDSIRFFSKKIEELHEYGCVDVIIDLGFGFNKEINDNYKLFSFLKNYHIFNKHILIGISRKSMIYRKLDIQPEDSLNSTTVLNTIAVLNNVSILRVHDIKEALELKRLYSLLDFK